MPEVNTERHGQTVFQTVFFFLRAPGNALAKRATTYLFDLEPRIPVSGVNSDLVFCDS